MMSLYNIGKQFTLLIETLQKIEGHLSWIARCHYQEFQPKIKPDKPIVIPIKPFTEKKATLKSTSRVDACGKWHTFPATTATAGTSSVS